MRNSSKCPHLASTTTVVDVAQKFGKVCTSCCDSCDNTGPNLWICLQRDCLRVGCSEQANDHSTAHFHSNNAHCVQLNMSSQRAWCYLCEQEVFLAGAEHSSQIQDPFTLRPKDDDWDGDSTASGTSVTTMGLVGLQNIANTCYMNSALQALSNLHPMTHYFLNCGDLLLHTADQAAHRSKAGLAKNYQSLMRDIWCRSGAGAGCKAYLAPRGILYGIRSVHSMFRGFQQHDTQEFLRCFMDQLHEELKEARPASPHAYRSLRTEPGVSNNNASIDDDDDVSSVCSSLSRSSSFSSGTDYETCDSGVSEKGNIFASSAQMHTAPTSGSAAADQQRATSTLRHNSSSQTQPQSLMRSIISDIFDGKLLSSVQCLTCDRISTREETFQDLSLPIPNRDYLNLIHQTHSVSAQSLNSIDAATMRNNNDGWLAWMWNLLRSWMWGPSVALHDCMSSFFSADELKGDNMYSCEKCNKLRTGVKYSQIVNLPEVLCIHLKRFRHDLSYSSKISAHVHFPLEGFDMRPYLHNGCTSRVSLYNLVSVICHHGTVGGGHYTCYARNTFNNNWYEYDDQHVTEVSSETVQNCQAYVLFYSKHDPQMALMRTEASEIAASNPAQTADIRFYVAREWLTRFNSFAEPGPISNWTMLCAHGGVLQSKVELLNQIAVPIAQPLWEFLQRKLGGGPAINMLFECSVCRREAEALARRQYYELAVFTKYNDMEDAELDASAIYAISMAWLRKWQQFVRGTTHREPGPITNASIVAPSDATPQSASTTTPLRSNAVQRTGKSDYAQISSPLWLFLHGIYGGGPEILLRSALNEEIEIIDQDEYEEELETSRNPDVSDTESNIGQQTPQAAAATESPTPALKQLREDIVRMEIDDTDRHAAPPLSSTAYPHIRDSKCSRHFMNGKKLKAPMLRTSLRKKGGKGRNEAMKNADFFGPKGTYVQESSVEELAQRLDSDTHAHADGVSVGRGIGVGVNDNNCDAFNCSRQSSSAFPSESGGSSQFSSSNNSAKANALAELSPDSEKIKTASSTSRHHHGRRKHKSKNPITLQKFAYLREPGEMDA